MTIGIKRYDRGIGPISPDQYSYSDRWVRNLLVILLTIYIQTPKNIGPFFEYYKIFNTLEQLNKIRHH